MPTPSNERTGTPRRRWIPAALGLLLAAQAFAADTKLTEALVDSRNGDHEAALAKLEALLEESPGDRNITALIASTRAHIARQEQAARAKAEAEAKARTEAMDRTGPEAPVATAAPQPPTPPPPATPSAAPAPAAAPEPPRGPSLTLSENLILGRVHAVLPEAQAVVLLDANWRPNMRYLIARGDDMEATAVFVVTGIQHGRALGVRIQLGTPREGDEVIAPGPVTTRRMLALLDSAAPGFAPDKTPSERKSAPDKAPPAPPAPPTRPQPPRPADTDLMPM